MPKQLHFCSTIPVPVPKEPHLGMKGKSKNKIANKNKSRRTDTIIIRVTQIFFSFPIFLFNPDSAAGHLARDEHLFRACNPFLWLAQQEL